MPPTCGWPRKDLRVLRTSTSTLKSLKRSTDNLGFVADLHFAAKVCLDVPL